MKIKVYLSLLFFALPFFSYSATIIFEQKPSVSGTFLPFTQNYYRDSLPPIVFDNNIDRQLTIFENGSFKELSGELSDYKNRLNLGANFAQYVNGFLLVNDILYKSDWTTLRNFTSQRTECAGPSSNVNYSQVQLSPNGKLVVAIRSCFTKDKKGNKLTSKSELIIFETETGLVQRAIADVRQFVWINPEEMILSNSPSAPSARDIEFYGWCEDGFNLGSKFWVDKLNTDSGQSINLWSVVREFDSCTSNQAEWVELNIRPDLNYGFITHIKNEKTKGIGFQLSTGAIMHQLQWAESVLTLTQHPYTYVQSANSFARVQPTNSEIRYSFFYKNSSGEFVRKILTKSWERKPHELLFLRDGLLEIDRVKATAIFYKTEERANPDIIKFCDTEVGTYNTTKVYLLSENHLISEVRCKSNDGSFPYLRRIWEIK